MNGTAMGGIERLRRWLADPLFVLLVLLPGLLGVVYEGVIASDVYIAEATFVVHNEDPHAPGRFSGLLAGVGLPPADETSSAVVAFVQSREALKVLDQDLGYGRAMASTSVDPLSRFGVLAWRRGFEYLLLYYRERIAFAEGGAANVLTLTVRAYEPGQTLSIASRLVDLAEAKVNALDRSVRDDVVHFAETDLADAHRLSLEADKVLAQARAGRGVYDPDRQVAVPLTVLGKLEEELASARTLLGSLEQIAPKNPQVEVLHRQVEGLETQLARERRSVAGPDGSLSNLAETLDALNVEHVAAAHVVGAAIQSLTVARADARRRRIYLERIADPIRPDVALEPYRLRGVLATLGLGLLLWAVIRLLVSAVREHQH